MKRGIKVKAPTYYEKPWTISDWTQQYSDLNRQFQGVASIAVTDRGTLWSVWYGGVESVASGTAIGLMGKKV